MIRWLWETLTEARPDKLLQWSGLTLTQAIGVVTFAVLGMFAIHWAVRRFGPKRLVDEWNDGLRPASKREGQKPDTARD